MDTVFLTAVCSIPWSGVGVANPERHKDGTVRANHVHVDCETPFVIAAASTGTPEGEEYFELCIVWQRDQLESFVQGPYPPHNRPNVVPWEAFSGENGAGFLMGRKRFSVLRRTQVLDVEAVSTLRPLEYGLVLEAAGRKLCIYADAFVPMAVRVTSDEVLEQP